MLTLNPFRRVNFYHLRQVKIISDDTWNNIPKSEFKINFYDDKEPVGYINYRAGTGQIGLFFLEEQYRQQGIGKQILFQTINHMREFKTEDIWAVSATHPHPFWSNVLYKRFKWYDCGKLHASVSGSGYKMKILNVIK